MDCTTPWTPLKSEFLAASVVTSEHPGLQCEFESGKLDVYNLMCDSYSSPLAWDFPSYVYHAEGGSETGPIAIEETSLPPPPSVR